jgi:hypothetical protein
MQPARCTGQCAEISTYYILPDIDTWRGGALMIKRHDDSAGIGASARTDDYEAKGERDGRWVCTDCADD